MIGNPAVKQHAQLILTDALNAEDYFVTDTPIGWNSENDQHNWYPMFNSLIDYIKQNSQSYGRGNSKRVQLTGAATRSIATLTQATRPALRARSIAPDKSFP